MSIADVLSGAARYCLIEGDCRDVLPTLGDKAVAHVITDPPYEAEAHTKQRRKMLGVGAGALKARGTKRGWSKDDVSASAPLNFEPITEAERSAVAGEMSRLTRRWALVFCQAEAVTIWRDALTLGGLTYRRACVWVKPDGQPQLSGDRPGMGYESIVAAHAHGRSRWRGGGRLGVFTHVKSQNNGLANDHPTQKPLPLMLDLVSLFTDPDDIILDPFAGSGTTGVAALRLGRRFIGIERDAKYSAVARERLAAEAEGSTLRARRAGQITLFGAAR